ncbi:uncharacterized protein LTR77_006403 [Saxophila tyrrhenica]|uniref:Carbohydrate kinase PfkB domain-containing protein n=1 Tax=Saxophila tyrrhenica TaxID=1690608 RepID=A0AAV9P7T0_9PEZI|nr:hypothetical protein LTR77_006403 [Saxophila tyrrhenica]
MLRTTWLPSSRCLRLTGRTRNCLGNVDARGITTNSRVFQVSDEVRQAVSDRRPIVALETTIYTHGFPYPDNLALSSHLESLVRKHGGVPATIGILNGVARVGMSEREIDQLVASAHDPNMLKISRRDFGFALGSKDPYGKAFNGGTTIAGTMVLAHMAGIKVFATGGLGGVHRGGETTMDISADLTELGRTPVAVISSGCKAFLDLPRTLEYLETQGVAVGTFADGREGDVDFPAFWTRESGVPSPKVIRDEQEAAEILHAHGLLGLQSGLHFANPIPEKHSLSKDVMEAAIHEALDSAKLAGSVGAAATPYILNKIKEVTGENSVTANKALVEGNVIRGTKVAAALTKLEADEETRPKGSNQVEDASRVVVGPGATNFTSSGVSKGVSPATANAQPSTPHKTSNSTANVTPDSQPNVFVAGSLAIDLSCDYAIKPGGLATGDSTLRPAAHTSNPAEITQSLGGVGGNVARAAQLMGAGVQLCSAVGDDLAGKAALQGLSETGMSTQCVQTLPAESGTRTAQYVAVNDSNRDLVIGMADMSILDSADSASTIDNTLEHHWLPELKRNKPGHLVLDANWSPPHLYRWLEAGREIGAHISHEPVSTAKSTRLFSIPKPTNSQDQPLPVFPSPLVDLATPNTHELTSLYNHARSAGLFDRADWWTIVDSMGLPSTGSRVQLSLLTTPALVDEGIPQQTLQLLPFIPSICTKLGSQGVLLTQLLPADDERLTSGEYNPFILSRCANGTEESVGVGGVYMRLFPAAEEVKAEDVVSVNGVGDTFLGALVAGMARKGKEARVEEFVEVAQRAAVETLRSGESVSPGLRGLV